MTGYDLGKAWSLAKVFAPRSAVSGCSYDEPMSVSAADVGAFAELLALAWTHDLEIADVHRRAPDAEMLAYWRLVALDIVDWSEGKLFEFHSEHSGLYERLTMDGWEDGQERLWDTGDRHDKDRDLLATRRARDEDFRRGNVWRVVETRQEIVRTTPGGSV